MAGKVFINYRRVDAEAWADRLYERLVAHLPTTDVFMDINGSIPLGLPWAEWLDSQVAACDLMLVLIGRSWVSEFQARATLGERDYVRAEIESALARKIPVVPVFLGETPVPSADSLPPSIRTLFELQATRLQRTSFEADSAKLIGEVARLIKLAHQSATAAADLAISKETTAAPDRRPADGLSVKHLAKRLWRPVLVYSALCLSYLVWVPLAAIYVPESVTWPERRSSLLLEIVAASAGFTVPFGVGVLWFANRYRTNPGDLAPMRIEIRVWVSRAAILFLASAVVYFMYSNIHINLQIVGIYMGSTLHLFQPAIIASTLMSSTIAPLSWLIWIMSSRLRNRWITRFSVCLATGLMFCATQYVFEALSGAKDHYYWHEFLLGACAIIFSFAAVDLTGGVRAIFGKSTPLGAPT